ncbi:FtsX-like permease family protein [Candidatus Dojkabacteria bacterium]|nr:FtsX-like permease family protein [Candidatus Dojkabacteria bacterium]
MDKVKLPNKKSIKNNLKRFSIIIYILLILVYLLLILFRYVSRFIPFFKRVVNFLVKSLNRLDQSPQGTISKVELIELAMQNMNAKKNRTSVTVGGMMVGIAGIVFLISIAYGLQSLVIDRVARLEELKQAEVTTQPGSKLVIDDDTVNSFAEQENIEMVLPQISVVGKINYNESATDMAVYGVTKDYLEQSAIAPVTGSTFENNEITTPIKAESQIELVDSSEVTEELADNLVEVEGESDIESKIAISKVIFPPEITDKNAVVNRAFLKVLDISEQEAIGKTFNISFTATNRSLLEDQNKLESDSTEYTIVGVTPDDITPLIYVPLTHLKSLGINTYSQVKLVVDKESNLANTRQSVENQGFLTSSVVDTVAKIDDLFGTVRIVLALLGTVALFVAGLGMFNTLTVSLLERTREIGLLKAMGMKSQEVKELFLAESMIMGTLGGTLGIIVGLLIGKILETIISLYAVLQGAGTITMVDIPISFAIFVLVLSFGVGVLTGIYPANRATKISALNALRYE